MNLGTAARKNNKKKGKEREKGGERIKEAR